MNMAWLQNTFGVGWSFLGRKSFLALCLLVAELKETFYLLLQGMGMGTVPAQRLTVVHSGTDGLPRSGCRVRAQPQAQIQRQVPIQHFFFQSNDLHKDEEHPATAVL